MRLRWSRFALEDRDLIFDYLANESPQAAIAVDIEIEQQISLLATFPGSGRIGRVPETRELIINRTPYIAAYKSTADTVIVLRILHSAQVWPDKV
ncbi:MAG: type II toxin-antitoxin system RelE/ParE family toxin [Aequoribacter sp.]|uniref:type II toxin-antitoxin system RelE/ParE family toxin n=1 Tax=Aequoribacter sp. TaxID=2847771 RepID=UPI003C314A18